jgi:hypothetical protein
VAVTVPQASPYIVFDDKDCIVEVGDLAMPVFGSFLGQSVWSCFPDSRSLYEPHYVRARRTGATVEFAQYYNGRVMRIKAVPNGSRITLWYEIVAILDVLTLEGLRESLDSALAALAAAEEAIRREQGRASLRLVGGRA